MSYVLHESDGAGEINVHAKKEGQEESQQKVFLFILHILHEWCVVIALLFSPDAMWNIVHKCWC